MKNQWKIFTVILVSVFLAGCTDMAEKKQLEEKVIALTEVLNAKDMEIQKLKDDLAAVQQSITAKSGVAATGDLTAKQVQTALKKAGFDPGAIDGKLGAKSKEAIKMFQGSLGLNADGSLNADTVSELKKYL